MFIDTFVIKICEYCLRLYKSIQLLTKIFSYLSKKKEIKVIDYDDTGFTSKRMIAIKTIIERK